MSVPARRRTYQVRPWHRDFFAVRNVGRFLRAQLEALVGPGTRVLDVGCGEQPLRAEVEARGGRYVGLDLDRAPGARDQVVGSVLALPLRGGLFDVVLCSEVLEHVPQTERAFAELVRVTRPGGHLVLTVPFAYPLHEEPHDFVRLTPHLLERLAGAHGLQVQRLDREGHEFEVLATVFDDLLVRRLSPRPSVLRRGLGAGLRAAANVAAMAARAVMGGGVPRTFGSVVAVLRRPP